ncbi:MAG: cation:proton antiporter [Thermoproteaceae archaeon]|nr:cation:proton antiporter [Thermoproteaceae archaeon]
MIAPVLAVSLTLLLGALLAYLLERAGLPPFLGFFLAGIAVSRALGVTAPAVYLELLLYLVAFEAGRALGVYGFSPAAFFAVILESSLIVGISLVAYRLIGVALPDAFIAALVMMSSSTVLALRFARELPGDARSIALSLTVLEDAVLFLAAGLILSGASAGSLPVNVVLTAGASLVMYALFKRVYRLFAGREYALVFALAMALGFAYAVSVTQVASPLLGAFIAGYIFSRAGAGHSRDEGLGALLNLVTCAYAALLGVSAPTATLDPSLLAASLLMCLVSMAVRALSVFLSALVMTGHPARSISAAASLAHVSEGAVFIPIVAYERGILKSAELALALTLVPPLSMFAAPLVWRWRGALEKYVAGRVGAARAVPGYERLYAVLSHAFLTAAKLVAVLLVAALALAYLAGVIGIYVALALAPAAYYSYRYSRAVYSGMLAALRESGEPAHIAVLALLSAYALAVYVVLTLAARFAGGEYHAVVPVVLLALTLPLLAALRELLLQRPREARREA